MNKETSLTWRLLWAVPIMLLLAWFAFPEEGAPQRIGLGLGLSFGAVLLLVVILMPVAWYKTLRWQEGYTAPLALAKITAYTLLAVPAVAFMAYMGGVEWFQPINRVITFVMTPLTVAFAILGFLARRKRRVIDISTSREVRLK